MLRESIGGKLEIVYQKYINSGQLGAFTALISLFNESHNLTSSFPYVIYIYIYIYVYI